MLSKPNALVVQPILAARLTLAVMMLWAVTLSRIMGMSVGAAIVGALLLTALALTWIRPISAASLGQFLAIFLLVWTSLALVGENGDDGLISSQSPFLILGAGFVAVAMAVFYFDRAKKNART